MDTTPRLYRAHGVRETVKEQGRSITWLADQVGYSRVHVSNVLNQRCVASEELAQRIATVLQIPLFLAFELSEHNTMSRADIGQEVAA